MNEPRNPNLPDVRLLKTEELPDAVFPGGRNQDFRVHFTPEVHRALWQHASEDLTVEICGVLVGTWGRDVAGPFVSITESIRGDAAESRLAEVTFTHETWSKINQEMDTRFAHLKIVGWYHTHPDFGVFLSDRDRFIQEHFFAGPGQVAHVIDPVRKVEGVFVWRDGKTALTEHYWVGDRLMVAPPSDPSEQQSHRRHAPGGEATRSTEPTGEAEARRRAEPAWLTILTQVLMYVCVFLLGFLISNYWSAWNRLSLLQAAVAEYGIWDGLRPGLRNELDLLNGEFASLARTLAVLRADHLKLAGTGAKDQPADWVEAASRLERAASRVGMMRSRYCASYDAQVRILKTIAEQIPAAALSPDERLYLDRAFAEIGMPPTEELQRPRSDGEGKAPTARTESTGKESTSAGSAGSARTSEPGAARASQK